MWFVFQIHQNVRSIASFFVQTISAEANSAFSFKGDEGSTSADSNSDNGPGQGLKTNKKQIREHVYNFRWIRELFTSSLLRMKTAVIISLSKTNKTRGT